MKKILLKLVVALHTLWALLILMSLPLTILNPGYHKFALTIAGLTIFVQLVFRGCPLTIIENRLKKRSYETFMGRFLRDQLGFSISDFWVEVFTTIYFVLLISFSIWGK